MDKRLRSTATAASVLSVPERFLLVVMRELQA
jgi:hypothetical protein